MTTQELAHFTDGDVECSCQPLCLTVAADGSISRIAGGPLEEPIDTTPTDLRALLADLVSFRVTNDAGECSWCEADNPARTADHRPTCPWRRAQEIVHASRS
jgi:hypothetical protein